MTGHINDPIPTGRSIYRCLIPMHQIMSDPELKPLYEGQLPGFLSFLDPVDDVFFITYSCRGNEVLNCGIVHNTRHQKIERETASWNEPVSWTDILETAHNFSPTAKKILDIASRAESDVKAHHLIKREPLPTFTRETTAVIGDAAHVMLPTQASGGAISIESAACLEILFAKIPMPIDTALIKRRLGLFDKLRLGRCNMVMILSNAGFAGMDAPGVEDEIRKYYGGPLPPSGSKPWSTKTRDLLFGYNVLEEARKVLSEGN
jgi:salicylate hydroxylase